MSRALLLLLLPALACARISVSVDATGSQADVQLSGSTVDIISDEEIQSFGVTDPALVNAIDRLVGGRPTDVFLRSPTPWNDLYQRFNWRQVRRTLIPLRATVLGVRSEPVIITTQEFINNSSVAVTYSGGITQQVQDTVTSTWTRGGELTVGQAINYEVKFGFGSVGGSTSLAYTSSWGKDHSKSQSVTLGSTAGVAVVLQPGEGVLATLSATRGSMEIQVDYAAHLDGHVAANYPRRFNGHHFWRYDVGRVQEAGRLRQTIQSSEVMRIGFFSNARSLVTNLESHAVLADVSVAMS